MKKLKQVGEQNKSDVVNKPVKTHEVRDYLKFQAVKKEQAAKLASEIRKSDDSPQMMMRQAPLSRVTTTLNSDRTTGKNAMPSLESSPSHVRKKSTQINLYEKIATDMRSQAIREEIKYTLKEPPTAQLSKKQDPSSQFFQNKNNQQKRQPASNTIRT